jgi:hypothetical protein
VEEARLGCAPCTPAERNHFFGSYSTNPDSLFYTTRHRTSVDLTMARDHDSLIQIDPQTRFLGYMPTNLLVRHATLLHGLARI